MTAVDVNNLRQAMASRYAAQRLPPMVILDVTNTCNLKCIHCPQPMLQASPGFKPNHMKWAHFTKIVDEIGAAGEKMLLRIAGDGEPSIHPDITEMVRYAKQKAPHAALNLTTNGLVMDRAQADAMLEAGIDLVDFSIDAYSKAAYDEVRRGGKYERLLANIFGFLDRRKVHRAKTKVMVSFVVQKENAQEVDLFRNFWTPVVDRVLIRQLHSAVNQIPSEKIAESRELNGATQRERFPCPHLWKRLTIDFRGLVKFCAHDWVHEEGVTLGRIEESSLEEIWHGHMLQTIRNHHVRGTYPEGAICTTCTDWASTRWDLGYERLIDKVVYRAPTLVTELSDLDD